MTPPPSPPPPTAPPAPSAPPTRRQLQAAATHDQLLAAARQVFSERGYQATTVGLITNVAETAHGTFYLHFANKEDAFGKVMAAVTEELYREGSAPSLSEPSDGVRTAIGGFLRMFAEHGPLWRALLEAAMHNASIERLWLDLRRQFVDRIERVLVSEQAAGRVRASLEPDLAAHALGSMVEWFAFTNLVMHDMGDSPDMLDRATDVVTDLWLTAVYGVRISEA